MRWLIACCQSVKCVTCTNVFLISHRVISGSYFNILQLSLWSTTVVIMQRLIMLIVHYIIGKQTLASKFSIWKLCSIRVITMIERSQLHICRNSSRTKLSIHHQVCHALQEDTVIIFIINVGYTRYITCNWYEGCQGMGQHASDTICSWHAIIAMCHLQPHKIQDETTGTVDVPDLELTIDITFHLVDGN